MNDTPAIMKTTFRYTPTQTLIGLYISNIFK